MYFERRSSGRTRRASCRRLYYNNGYIYVNVRPDVLRRVGPDGKPVVDLRWVITEGQPAIVSHVEIRGNDFTHERVIREAIVMVPGDVFRQDALIASYQAGVEPRLLQSADAVPRHQAGERAGGHRRRLPRPRKKRTGNINFGASVGQGTGVGGFLGLDEPNLFGQGKARPVPVAVRQERQRFRRSRSPILRPRIAISATIGVHNTRVRYVVAISAGCDAAARACSSGSRVRRQLYAPIPARTASTSRASRAPIRRTSRRSAGNDCVRSTIGASLMRDTRIDLPFPTAGTMVQLGLSQSGGLLGGSGTSSVRPGGALLRADRTLGSSPSPM